MRTLLPPIDLIFSNGSTHSIRSPIPRPVAVVCKEAHEVLSVLRASYARMVQAAYQSSSSSTDSSASSGSDENLNKTFEVTAAGKEVISALLKLMELFFQPEPPSSEEEAEFRARINRIIHGGDSSQEEDSESDVSTQHQATPQPTRKRRRRSSAAQRMGPPRRMRERFTPPTPTPKRRKRDVERWLADIPAQTPNMVGGVRQNVADRGKNRAKSLPMVNRKRLRK